MFLGIDLGTSGIKVVLTNPAGELVASQTAELQVSRPHPLWSEQAPTDWWAALELAMAQLQQQHDLSSIEAIGLSGQMHGATLLDKAGEVIRPAILWNDGRSQQQCTQLEQAVPDSRQITGNIMMPGFTAPKLLWLRQHEPDNFARIDKVLLPKDYLRFCLTGDFASDMSDSAGTLWLDMAKRQWHEGLLAATGLNAAQMPRLYEGNQITGYLKPEIARRWNMHQVPVVAGGGDNAAGAVGVGIVRPGQAMLSLGTSGVYFAVTEGFRSNPDSAVHAFCHALPDTWHLMSVMLSAASCLQWYADSAVGKSVSELLDSLQRSDMDIQQSPYFLPYLSGERTPHNNPLATGNWFGLTHDTSQNALTHSVLEGVSFGFADGVDALHQAGVTTDEITLIGGGARSPYWRQMLADVLNRPVVFRQGGEVGPALGAARLAQLGCYPQLSIEQVCPVPELVETHKPDPQRSEIYANRRSTFKQLYKQLAPLF